MSNKSNKYSQNFINNLDEQTYETLEQNNYLTQKKLEKLILDAKDTYYNNTGILTIQDTTFDLLIEILETKYPKSKILDVVGSELPAEATNKVRLPYHLGSMDKVKPGSSKFRIWTEKYNTKNYIISEKLDGLSGLLILSLDDNSDTPNKINSRLYTRGDGNIGQDISHLLPFLKFNLENNETLASRYKHISKYMKDNKYEQIAIRGEIIISKEKFNKKYSNTFPKGRSLVAGVVNSKADGFNKPDLRNRAKDIDFVSYQLVYPEYSAKEQFEILNKKLKFKTAYNEWFNNNTITIDECETLLLKFKENSKYEIDGIIITDNVKVYSNPVDGNPKHSVAFKMALEEEQAKETVVEYVEYNVSKNGILKPRIKYHPIKIGGDTFVYATGFNAKYIKENNLGQGSRIVIIKSGDVIPYIYKILSSSISGKWQEPEQEWHWNETGVEAVIDNISDLPMEKVMLQFFNQFEIDGMKEGVISRLVNAGLDTINDILRMKVETLIDIEGFQMKSSKKLVEQIQKKIVNVKHDLDKLMVASNCFPNFGIRKLRLVTNNFTVKDILDTKIKMVELVKIDGLGEITSRDFLEYLPKFKEWLNNHSILKVNMSIANTEIKIDSYIQNKKICFTGFRNKELEAYVNGNGGIVSSSVSGNTSLVVAKDINESSSKINKAREKGIEIVSMKDFISRLAMFNN